MYIVANTSSPIRVALQAWSIWNHVSSTVNRLLTDRFLGFHLKKRIMSRLSPNESSNMLIDVERFGIPDPLRCSV